jgi:drug/metabolite transporter (DMT)-like permease
MALRGTARGMAWMVASGLLFIALTTVTRALAQDLPPWQTQCLRFLAGLLVMVPWILRRGFVTFRPAQPMGHVWRGAIHSSALLIWFHALPSCRSPRPRRSASPRRCSCSSAPCCS